jgi:hypothetical protein
LPTGVQPSDGALPAGLLVRGASNALRAAFPGLIDLQPVDWLPEGLVCAPRAAPDRAHAAMSRCPFVVERLVGSPACPEPAARIAGGWYVRSPDHAPAPRGVRELVESPGEGFGPLAHPSTDACLSLMGLLPAGSAIDVGCGSGLLTQAWATLGYGPVRAIDVDPQAVLHTRRTLAAAPRSADVRVDKAAIETLPSTALEGRVLLANLPPIAHAALVGRIRELPRAVLVAGMRHSDSAAVIAGYTALGLRPTAARIAGRWSGWVLERPDEAQPPHE